MAKVSDWCGKPGRAGIIRWRPWRWWCDPSTINHNNNNNKNKNSLEFHSCIDNHARSRLGSVVYEISLKHRDYLSRLVTLNMLRKTSNNAIANRPNNGQKYYIKQEFKSPQHDLSKLSRCDTATAGGLVIVAAWMKFHVEFNDFPSSSSSHRICSQPRTQHFAIGCFFHVNEREWQVCCQTSRRGKMS